VAQAAAASAATVIASCSASWHASDTNHTLGTRFGGRLATLSGHSLPATATGKIAPKRPSARVGQTGGPCPLRSLPKGSHRFSAVAFGDAAPVRLLTLTDNQTSSPHVVQSGREQGLDGFVSDDKAASPS